MNNELDSLQRELLEILTVGALLANNYDKVEIEILAGAGGLSAGMSVQEQYELYLRFINYMGWVIESEEIDKNDQKELGYSKVQLTVSGEDIIEYMEYEKGVHRIQERRFQYFFAILLCLYRSTELFEKSSKRIPPNSSAIQTNTIMVKVFPILERTTIKIPRSDLQIKSGTGTGKGGQKINNSKIMAYVTHIPTGITVNHFESGGFREGGLETNTGNGF